jgi:stringent starvation protein A
MATSGSLSPVTLYDAARCPFCARVRIVLAEKQVPYETVEIDLSDRPAWLYEKNPAGKVPVLEEAGWLLPESAVISEYLEERYPEPPLLPADPGERALARLLVYRFDDDLGDAYYAFRRREPGAERVLGDALAFLDSLLARMPFLTGEAFGLADVAYVPWVIRARDMLGLPLDGYATLEGWLERLAERPSIAQELGVVSAL